MDQRAIEYAKLHRKSLQDNQPDVYAQLLKSGELQAHLSSIGSQASEMFEHLLAQKNNDPEVQSLPYHEKARRMASHVPEANEVVMRDLINPDPSPGAYAD